MKKLLLLFLIGSLGISHSGDLDSKGGHSCSTESKNKGLCTKYHYHINSDIKKIQQILKNLNYYKGNINGVYGTETKLALKNYLSDRNVVDPKLDSLINKLGLSKL